MNIFRKHALPGIALVALFAFLIAPFMAEAQTQNPVLRIEETSGGNVEIEIPDDLLELILTPPEAKKQTKSDGKQKATSGKMQGFRIQVFSDGRNQHTLEARAKARGSQIIAKFPKYRGQVYVFSKSPNWYTRIGNFRTKEEATKAMKEMQRAFPQFSSEMRLVNSTITVTK